MSQVFRLALAFLFALAADVAKPQEARYVGSAACASCHKMESDDWLQSQHKAAMQEPADATVLGRFDGAAFIKDGVKTLFSKDGDGKFIIRTDGPDEKPADFPVQYVFGLYPLQQYLLELPGGRLQAFGIAWDARPAERGGQRWYDLYPGRKVSPGNPLHWTGIDQNWNYQCAWCHSTNLRKNYDPATGSFSTTFSEIGVGCEACHGPASEHLAWAAKPNQTPHRGFALGLDQRKGVSWSPSASGMATRIGPPVSDKEALVCASCHARRQQFSDDALAVARFYDAFRPVGLDEGLYHVDGQQRDEVYIFGSFIQSRMHAAGVTCSDCHNPHSGKLRLAGNAVCSQCHTAAVFDAPPHHHHAQGSAGAQCANCHVPAAIYMGVDARRDHSMRNPRPDRTASLATPNACNNCHANKSAAWAVEALKSWGAGAKPGAQTFAEGFRRADRGAPGAVPALAHIIEDDSQSAIARASALQRLSQAPTQAALDIAMHALAGREPMVRTSAIAVLANADAAKKLRTLAPLLGDQARVVRMDAARALAGDAEVDLSPADRLAFEKALEEYIAAQAFNAERPESHANLGALHLARGLSEAARAEYEKALALDKTFAPAAISLAEIERMSGDELAAEITLRKSLEQNPDSGSLAHVLGLSLIRQKRMAEALEKLEQAVKFSPDDPRFAFVYGVALHDAGAPEKALAELNRALGRHPFDRDILSALASYEAKAGDSKAALAHVQLLVELDPEDRSARAMASAIEARAARRH
ncbi:multiheme c-type cytochrome (plasmid) [Methylocystis sp. MJC1]|jgi:tetratricopeptide (TPR) repeat protein|uniref:tetratricopeptide repeat protein n=1 Tax=Methylocystis sp. MJC1 TaxID=2654282 RepID=UPI0013EB746E|nr:tetratricopeptide repeat protein [Methylocystis sp. MJC1]KAF2991511.1 Beta-barrel assembly-enhancing protease [Methylocystis sp. MJC1]MBU6529176.1 tetratricopeptide repeat protein [Methylocystis sp. MJC1]UZX13858.1 multiheme c-type cytochrome [Methylocystis sp. MJC1]